jgi:hypothetical protein
VAGSVAARSGYSGSQKHPEDEHSDLQKRHQGREVIEEKEGKMGPVAPDTERFSARDVSSHCPASWANAGWNRR